MKKLLFLLLIFIFFSSSAMAETIVVKAMNDISTINPPKTCKIKILSDIQLDDNLFLKSGDIVMGRVIDVKDPQKLKRNAKFSIEIFGIYKNSKLVNIEQSYVGRYTTQIDKTEAAKNAALSVGNFFVKGLSMGYHAVEGAVKNEENNRVKSSAVAVYKNSPLSYVETGEEIYIKKGNIFYLKFKNYKDKKVDEEDED